MLGRDICLTFDEALILSFTSNVSSFIAKKDVQLALLTIKWTRQTCHSPFKQSFTDLSAFKIFEINNTNFNISATWNQIRTTKKRLTTTI